MCSHESAIKTLFAAYRQTNEYETMEVYAAMLEDVPAGLLNKTIKKCICEKKFLPSVAEIREAAQALVGSVDPSRKVKTWQEAQEEIAKGLSRTWFKGCLGEIPVDHPEYGLPCDPMWSTPEIAAAVNSYGMDNLAQVLVEDMPTVWAQLRRLYEQACRRRDEESVNVYVLGGDAEMLQRSIGNIGLLKEAK